MRRRRSCCFIYLQDQKLLASESATTWSVADIFLDAKEHCSLLSTPLGCAEVPSQVLAKKQCVKERI
jgi:hypothetical protein